jgi:hypothetical protein
MDDILTPIPMKLDVRACHFDTSYLFGEKYRIRLARLAVNS